MADNLWAVRLERSPNDHSVKTAIITGWDILQESFANDSEEFRAENWRGPFSSREEAENCANVLLANAGEPPQAMIY